MYKYNLKIYLQASTSTYIYNDITTLWKKKKKKRKQKEDRYNPFYFVLCQCVLRIVRSDRAI